ncbi:MAG: HisA/HisF family protein [Planctomycetaceae bacterium]
MRILPVIDIQNGVVVHGVAGERASYQPVQSCLTDDADVRSIARAFRSQFDISELYVADLDGIQRDQPNLNVYRELQQDDFTILLDAGLREMSRAREFFEAGADSIICGLETCSGSEQVTKLVEQFGSERVIFSLDLKLGRPLADVKIWNTDDPFRIAKTVIESGIRRMIVLDLAAVGVGGGVEQLRLCERLLEANSDLELITGGGVRDVADLKTLKAKGIGGVLIASAFHSGSITPDDLKSL